jgi:hypothetical protein
MCRLKEFDDISGRIGQKDLRSTWASHDIVAELDSAGTQSGDFCSKIVHDEMNAIPTAGPWLFAVWHRSPCRTFRSAEQEP